MGKENVAKEDRGKCLLQQERLGWRQGVPCGKEINYKCSNVIGCLLPLKGHMNNFSVKRRLCLLQGGFAEADLGMKLCTLSIEHREKYYQL